MAFRRRPVSWVVFLTPLIIFQRYPLYFKYQNQHLCLQNIDLVDSMFYCDDAIYSRTFKTINEISICIGIFVVAENKNVGIQILLVKEGKVEIKPYDGALIGIIGSGDVLSADFNNEQNLIVITRRNGKVEVFSENGALISRIGNGDAIAAKWNGDDLAITTKGGKVEVRNKTNSLIRIF